MFLKKLTIHNESTIIRDIPFHKGLNLIVDETQTSDRKESGNSVGKTTVLRLIDYCFGSSGSNIYKDPEFKGKTNSQVEEFLKKNNIIISMTLKEDLELTDSLEIEIRRNFLSKKEKIFEINGEQQTIENFPKKLKELIFKSPLAKPTFRQIIAKNIRDEKNRITNTLKVLNSFATKEEYESLFLFWLGIELDTNERKQQLVRDQKTENNLLQRLKKEASLSQIEQSLIVINRTIEELTLRKNSFVVNESYEEDLEELNKIKLQINERSTAISSLVLRRDLILESKTELENEVSSVDDQQIKSLYQEAKVLIPELQKTFEDTIRFHNQMILHKVEYIAKEIPDLEEKLAERKREMSELLVLEKKLAQKLKKAGAVEELQKVVSDLNNTFEKKGSLEEQKRLWELSIEKLDNIEKELNKINAGIDSKDDQIQKRIAEFNKYFSELSNRLYGEQFVLSSDDKDKDKNVYEFKVSSLSGNLGTGKKKGQIAAFDLAYIQFADAEGIECLHFVLQDQIENIHDNQISSILTEIVAEVNCQYILPVLKDKLPVEIDIDQYQVLSLSQSDKLFRIP
ncbi:DUF2326 domain-containing protein [Gimesia aquarii]|uniref:DUF2326 domain-containing protein n=1 Tax=Gimesia aquarii TaxID=2527964 RepID=A0A517VTD2_9PLAN|nr:DUF2326 domain-containing protein [Gimesia aquarii]QDT96265.1 hypothetical protein V144x_17190 [Gimesia aquarii]